MSTEDFDAIGRVRAIWRDGAVAALVVDGDENFLCIAEDRIFWTNDLSEAARQLWPPDDGTVTWGSRAQQEEADGSAA